MHQHDDTADMGGRQGTARNIIISTLPQVGIIDFADIGKEALQKALTKQYDIVFLDVTMPGLDGYETCMRFRAIPAYKRTPIIMVTGNTSPIDEAKGITSGYTTYVTKPIQQENFRNLSKRVFSWLDANTAT